MRGSSPHVPNFWHFTDSPGFSSTADHCKLSRHCSVLALLCVLCVGMSIGIWWCWDIVRSWLGSTKSHTTWSCIACFSFLTARFRFLVADVRGLPPAMFRLQFCLHSSASLPFTQMECLFSGRRLLGSVASVEDLSAASVP